MHEARRFEPWPGIDWPPPARLIPAWAWQLAVGAALVGALLVAFHEVVQGAVADGDRRRMTDARLAMAVSQCNTLGELRASADCLREVGMPVRAGVPAMLALGPLARDH